MPKILYKILRKPEIFRKRAVFEDILLENLEMDSFLIDKTSWLKGHTLKSLDIRAKTGVAADLVLKEGDIIIYIGNKKQLIVAFNFFQKFQNQNYTEKNHSQT